MITLGALLPVGSVIHSMLTEAQFQAQIGSGWVLADGRSATGTVYNTVTGATTIPDMRGKFLRGKNNGASGANYNQDGDSTLGTYQADKNLAHIHSGTSYASGGTTSGVVGMPAIASVGTSPYTGQVISDGGSEANPKNVTVNIFIRVN
jgi:hypothetical protein